MVKITRVLHIVTTMNRGGLETMLMNYYRYIDHTKVQFDFLVHRDFESDYDKEILSLGGKIYHLPRLNPLSMDYRKQLDKFFKEHQEYEIIHVHQDCLSSIALKYAKKNDIPIRIAHAHNTGQDKNIKYLVKSFYMRSISKYATHLFACGIEAGDWMFRGSDYTVLNNAIDIKKFIYNENIRDEIRNRFNIAKNEIVIGHVGRFNFQKNHEFLINIFNEMHKLVSNSKLMLIGIGNLQNLIKEKVKELGLEDNVLFLGNRSDVNELMQAMDIFVFPSHYEGLPVTLIEAQASGLPIIKSNSISEQCVITPNVYSLSLSDNVQKWSQKILETYKDYQRNDTSSYIKDAGFDIERNAKWLQNLYLGEVKKL